jgi:hypothetical protein
VSEQELRELRTLLEAFRDGGVTPEDFVERYSSLWRKLNDEVDSAIAAHPSVGPTLPRLREMESRGEISTDEYLARVQGLYESLSGVQVRPGTAAAHALDHVYAEADAWDATQDTDEPLVSLDELQEAVRQAIRALSDQA